MDRRVRIEEIVRRCFEESAVNVKRRLQQFTEEFTRYTTSVKTSFFHADCVDQLDLEIEEYRFKSGLVQPQREPTISQRLGNPFIPGNVVVCRLSP